ncbi:MAG: hypothetical protein ABSE99_04110 [Terracidiphilus sp.]|jgi:hypothetical protein
MDRTEKERAERSDSKIDRILATEEELIPSSGFLASVMESVHLEAAAPQPIPFPWVRALPGIMLAAGLFGWGGFELVREGIPAVRELALTSPQFPAAVALRLEQAGWVALALGASLLSWLLSRRLAGRSGLL